MPRIALCPPVSINAFHPNGFRMGLLLGASPSVSTSSTNRIRSASRQSRSASKKSWSTVLLVARYACIVRRSNGLPRHAGSENRLSPLAGASSDRPSAIESSSRPSVPARDATVRGCLARLSANLLHAVLGIILSAMPTAELVNSRSNGAASSSALLLVVATTGDYASSVGGGVTSRRSSFPVGPVGRPSTNQIRRGYL